MSISKSVRPAAIAAGVILIAAASSAGAGVKVGVLHCDVARGWGFILGSSKALDCTFSSPRGDIEHYTGTVSKFGVDIGYTRGGLLIWDVIAPATGSHVGALQGSYAGATVGAAIGVGGGAHALVGGFHKSVALQPISIVGESGLNVAAGIGAISLKYDG